MSLDVASYGGMDRFDKALMERYAHPEKEDRDER